MPPQGAHRLDASLMDESVTARLCVPVCVARARDLAAAIASAREKADIIELRLDCVDANELPALLSNLPTLIEGDAKPFIYTLRPAEQGGRRELTLDARLEFWRSHIGRLLRDNHSYADLELDVATALSPADTEADADTEAGAPDWSRVICSFHDFAGLPENLSVTYDRMTKTRAGIIKLAVQAHDVTDCLPVLGLLERARSEGRPMIALAMGEAGLLTRVLGPSRGSFLTYGSLGPEQATAPGQIPAAELKDLYRIHQLDGESDIYGLVGDPVSHSVSPQMHSAAFAAAAGINGVYLPLAVKNVNEFMRRLVRPDEREVDWRLRGLSVTAPHKSAIMPHLDWIEPAARAIGAVNTVRVEGRWLSGFNTDAPAALAPLRQEVALQGARVALIGAGGAARALLWGLGEAGARVTVFARNLERAKATASNFGADCAELEGAQFGDFQVVINATPLGTRGAAEAETPALASQLVGTEVAYDLVYNPLETRFLREARVAGCRVIGGLEMLIAQAAAQFKLWRGVEAPFSEMRRAAVKALTAGAS